MLQQPYFVCTPLRRFSPPIVAVNGSGKTCNLEDAQCMDLGRGPN